jgi:hypothetical protein
VDHPPRSRRFDRLQLSKRLERSSLNDLVVARRQCRATNHCLERLPTSLPDELLQLESVSFRRLVLPALDLTDAIDGKTSEHHVVTAHEFAKVDLDRNRVRAARSTCCHAVRVGKSLTLFRFTTVKLARGVAPPSNVRS